MAEAVKFGTSGLRGLATELEGATTRRYVAAFLQHLAATGRAGAGSVYLGRDLRESSPSIVADCAAAIAAAGSTPVDCGVLPTPALALHAMALGGPAIMVTGSHIPADRNGLKFYAPDGEISKADEAGILAALGADSGAGDGAGAADEAAAAAERYRSRYAGFLRPGLLAGWRIGVFQHSSVARDLLGELLEAAGASVVPLGRSEQFVPVDTEAFADAIYLPRHAWIATHALDAVVSTDGDGDRPLLIDAAGQFVRGDVLGMIAARAVGAGVVVTPVTSNSAIEAVGWFHSVLRTKVGSPFVIAGMAEAAPGRVVVGFEANGGTLLGSAVHVNGRALAALPTRDAVLPLLAALGAAASAGQTLAEFVGSLPVRAALSDRLTEVPSERSQSFLGKLTNDDHAAQVFFASVGSIAEMSQIDGIRFTLDSGDVVHYRASGNAPELRCYVEGLNMARAEELLAWGLGAAAREVR